MRRSALADHQRDPNLVAVHFMAMQQTIEGLQSKNRLLEKRLAVATGPGRDKLVSLIKSATNVKHIQPGDRLAKAIETFVGAEGWEEIRKGQGGGCPGLLGLIAFLARNHERVGESGGVVVATSLQALVRAIAREAEKEESSSNDEDEESDNLLQWLKDSNAIAVLTESLDAFITHREAQLQGWLVLEKMVAGEDAHRNDATNLRACLSATKAIKAFPEDETVLMAVLSVLELISLSSDECFEARCVEACEAVIGAVKATSSDKSALYNGLSIIGCLVCDTRFKIRLVDLGACKVAIDSLRSFSDSKSIQRMGCFAIINLATYGYGQKALGELGACEAVQSAMKAFEEERLLQENGCWALENLALLESNRVRCSQLKVWVEVLAAMKRFADEQEVQDYGCGALFQIAAVGGSKDTIGKADGCELVVDAMKAFMDDVDVQNAACWVISQLAGDNARNKARFVKAGALDAVLRALRAFPTEGELQQRGVNARDVLQG